MINPVPAKAFPTAGFAMFPHPKSSFPILLMKGISESLAGRLAVLELTVLNTGFDEAYKKCGYSDVRGNPWAIVQT